MINPAIIETVQTKYHRLYPLMNERMRRQWAACEALALDRGGVAAVAQATGLSRTTIWAGMRALH
jgi:transcriptional regulator of acetoin/glycerol metabolism